MENQEKENADVNEYEGYSLFKDIEDTELRSRNRAVVLWNIFETHSKAGRSSANGMRLMVGYAAHVPVEERQEMIDKVNIMMTQKGNV